MDWLDNMYRRLREFTTNRRAIHVIRIYSHAEYENNRNIPK